MGESGADKRANARKLLDHRRKTVAISLGIDVPIRGIPADELVLVARRLLDVSTLGTMKSFESLAPGPDRSVEDANKAFLEFAASPRGKEFFELIERVVRAGSLDPVFGTDPAEGAVVSDLPLEDQFLLFGEILTLSGYSKKVAETIRPS